MPDDAVDDLGYGDVLGLGFRFDPLDEGLFDVQRPALGRGRGLIRGVEEMLSLAPPGKNLLKISEIRERYINVDICSSTFVDFGGATIVNIGGLRWK